MLSAGAWTFFTADSLALIAMLQQQLSTRRKVDETSHKIDTATNKVDDAATAAQRAVENTQNVSNGFASGVRNDLKELTRLVTLALEASQTQSERMTDHERKDHGNARTQPKR